MNILNCLKPISLISLIAYSAITTSYAQSVFEPQQGKLLFIGQNIPAILDYNQVLGKDYPFDGIMTYSSYANMEDFFPLSCNQPPSGFQINEAYQCSNVPGYNSSYTFRRAILGWSGINSSLNESRPVINNLKTSQAAIQLALNLGKDAGEDGQWVLPQLAEKWDQSSHGKDINHIADSTIDELANYIQLINRPVFLRIGYEIDNYNPELYNKAYQYIHSRLNYDLGQVTGNPKTYKVAYILHLAMPDINRLKKFVTANSSNNNSPIPIDDIDWIGFSYFPSTNQEANDINQYLTSFYPYVINTLKKPIIIAEASPRFPQDYPADGTETMNSYFATLAHGSNPIGWLAKVMYDYPNIKALSYINQLWGYYGWKKAKDQISDFWGDSRVNAYSHSPSVLINWQAFYRNQNFIKPEELYSLIQFYPSAKKQLQPLKVTPGFNTTIAYLLPTFDIHGVIQYQYGIIKIASNEEAILGDQKCYLNHDIGSCQYIKPKDAQLGYYLIKLNKSTRDLSTLRSLKVRIQSQNLMHHQLDNVIPWTLTFSFNLNYAYGINLNNADKNESTISPKANQPINPIDTNTQKCDVGNPQGCTTYFPTLSTNQFILESKTTDPNTHQPIYINCLIKLDWTTINNHQLLIGYHLENPQSEGCISVQNSTAGNPFNLTFGYT
ncbi:MAG: hypothetical protein EP298_03990 [Gammaproteobacteria bacterium]|nr:MAG: hypothetical protein EP298_03990 [Gammaproteobacteria bacterium]UTW43790.1 glycosyl hydrolase 53 family protein [bacterium SCSIO 12844]